MGKQKSFYQQEYGQHIGATIHCVTSFLALAFMTCGTPLGVLMFRDRVDEQRSCYTLWGIRTNCWNAAYSWRIEQETCNDVRVRFESAEAFSIIAIFAIMGVFACSWYKLCNSDCKTATTLMALLAIGSTTVPWAVVTSFYYTYYCGKDTLTRTKMYYGAGYALMVTSFAVQVVGLILFLALEAEKPVNNRKLLSDMEEKSGSSAAAGEEEEEEGSHHSSKH